MSVYFDEREYIDNDSNKEAEKPIIQLYNVPRKR